jgi:hypothetical protein
MNTDELAALEARVNRRALLIWTVRETLGLILAATCIVVMIWLPWVTGRPVITVLDLSLVMWIVRTLLLPRPPRLVAVPV